LEKGVATVEDIDLAVNTGFGFRLPVVGPLAFLDMSGLDNVLHNWDYLNQVTQGGFGPSPKFIQELVAKGHLGIKTGKGIYDYGGKDASNIAKEKNRQLILMLKALGRI
ncbi:MAG: 3-hydroxyacyl-CoA dehydrogenase family protein, partial [Deltaproteobacteria bacterium]|nr:3-hydroxyacyl-CoA dehydrogenase family protein [Deltaproteobacteria bacterium]